MDFEALRVDAFPVDVELQDAGVVGPELAHLASVYRRSPRALVWRNPSSDWRLFVLLPPLALLSGWRPLLKQWRSLSAALSGLDLALSYSSWSKRQKLRSRDNLLCCFG